MQTVTSYASPGYASMQAQMTTQCQQRSNISTPMYSNVQQQQMQAIATTVFAQQPQPQRPSMQSAQPLHHGYSPYQRPAPTTTAQQLPPHLQPQQPQLPSHPPTNKNNNNNTILPQTLSFDFTNYQQQQQHSSVPQQIPQQIQLKMQQPVQQQNQQIFQQQQQQQQQFMDFTVPNQLQTPLYPQQTLSPQKK
eukprot:Phypoly_transcript_15891.p1 GENE.Phypoly_transcript_15891~~Phypoly_transcript_15891.p1  ORF type:complete len:192 (+),score=59.74 Phypoly_transcript_15891:148-723(+)